MALIILLLGIIAPRLVLVFLWLFTPIINSVFSNWIYPLLGIIFLPFTTLLYVLLIGSRGITSIWDWIIIIIGLLLDMYSYSNT